jgi:hypothetical protein
MNAVSTPVKGKKAIDLVVGLDHFPEPMRSLSTLTRIDYADLVTAEFSGTAECSAEEWAYTVLEETATGRAAPLVWHLLGLRLGPRPSTAHVQGWRIDARGHNWFRVETSSFMMSAQAVVRVADDEVALALYVRFDKPIAAVVWSLASRLHRRGFPVMLHQAVKIHDSK